MQETFDWLYSKSSENDTKGIDLYSLIISEKNILLAYRMIKSNTGSKTAGTDNLTINDYKMKDQKQFILEIRKTLENYQPKSVRRIEIPKSNGKMRPLGIPTMQDRLIQQMFKQVLEPICEAKFFNHSYGFRPNRSAQHALSRCAHLINIAGLHLVVDVDIESFFDNVNHTKLLKQLYTIGIKDRRVLAIIYKMLKAPIQSIGTPEKGTPQGGILSPLLSNVVLNDLDWWIASQWETLTSRTAYSRKSDKYRQLKKTSKLKQQFIVRYADDLKIFTKDYKQALRIFHGVSGYLGNHLKLPMSTEKSQITNLRKRSTNFLGFDLKAVPKRNKYVCNTHVSRKRKEEIKKKLQELIIKIQKMPIEKSIYAYNSYVLGVHNYYRCATHVSSDFKRIQSQTYAKLASRVKKCGKWEIPRSPPSPYKIFYKNNYKTVKIGRLYLFPLEDIKWKHVPSHNQKINDYSEEGRLNRYEKLDNVLGREIQKMCVTQSKGIGNDLEYLDNRISKYSMQNGKCAVTGIFLTTEELHCHHIKPKCYGGTNKFSNLVIVHKWVHQLIHCTNNQKIITYLNVLKLTEKQLKKVNSYRKKSNLAAIYESK